MAIGVVNHKTTGVRLIPVPGKDVVKGQSSAVFSERLILMEVRNMNCFLSLRQLSGGEDSCPITSINN